MSLQRFGWVLMLGALLLLGFSVPSRAESSGATRSFVILALNDVYRIEGVDQGTRGGLARVRSLRKELEREHPDLLVLHAGDFLFPSLLSRQYRGKQMVDVLNRLDGDSEAFDPQMFVTFGNHEFDKRKVKDAAELKARIEESQFDWLGSNIVFNKDENGVPLVKSTNLFKSRLVESGGVRVGLFSLTTNSAHPRYVADFGTPEDEARRWTRKLRKDGAEVVVALTHQLVSQDKAVLEQLGPEGPDLIIGGHEHDKQKEQVQGRWVFKADADARTATIVTVTVPPSGSLTVHGEFRDLGPERPVPDAVVQASVDQWITRHNRDYCGQVLKRDPGCLDEVLGTTRVTLIGEELEIRKYETNLGDWIVDHARLAFKDRGAQVAFINSGALRLNQNIPAGTAITRRHVEQIFAYPAPLKLLRIKGSILQDVVSHAVHDWTGNGWWLQISGFAFRHDAANGSADHLTLLTAKGPRPIKSDEDLLVVTNTFLFNGGDGYDMLPLQQVVPDTPSPDLKQLVVKALTAQASKGEEIAPKVEGRICNSERILPCQAHTP